jgi:hypothetical protein
VIIRIGIGGFRRKRVIDPDILSELSPATLIPDPLDLLAVLMTGILPLEMRDVSVGPDRDVGRKSQVRDEHPTSDFPPRIQVGNIPYQEETSADFEAIALVAQLFQIRATTYQFA